jgi:hypothetical protein
MDKKLLDEQIPDTLTSAIFPHINREDVTPVLQSTSRRDVEARDSDQISAPKGAEDDPTQPTAISRHHRLPALLLFGRKERLRMRPKRLRANVAKEVEIVDSQSSDVHVHLSTGSIRYHDRLLSLSVAKIGRDGGLSHPTTAPQSPRVVSQPVDGAFRRDAVDLAARQADIHQLPVAEVVQGHSLALAPLQKYTPVPPEQAEDDGEVEAAPCGIDLNFG